MRVLAPNPGPYTGPGTNTYLLISKNDCLVVDPGPLDDGHLAAIHEGLRSLRPVAVAVTHTHADHAELAGRLAAELQVPVCGYASGPEFVPDRRLLEGERIGFGSEEVVVLHTPGHSPDHLCYLAAEELLTGDHIMGGSTVMVDDMTAYLASLRRLLDLQLKRLHPGHGPSLDHPRQVIVSYLEHRAEREHQILEAVRADARTVEQVVERVYAEVDPALHPLAAHSVTAHLRKLEEEGLVRMGSGGWEALHTPEDRHEGRPSG